MCNHCFNSIELWTSFNDVFFCNSTASIYLDLHHSVWNGPDGRLIWNYATCISYKITNHVSFYKQLNASTVQFYVLKQAIKL